MSPTRLDVLVHELRSPVAALAAIAEAYPTADEQTRHRLIELAHTAGVGLERLLADVAAATLRLSRIDMEALVRDAAETAALAGARIVVDAEAGLLVIGDGDRLRQALDNLIENAVGHSSVEAAVTVSARCVGESVVLSVTDRGDGIELDDHERIFEAGVRVTTARPGSGIGLAVVRKIALEHGGDVEVESSPGEGSTFRLVLPAAFDAR